MVVVVIEMGKEGRNLGDPLKRHFAAVLFNTTRARFA